MGFIVLHIQKPKGNDARTTAHIERTVQPGNADPKRKELNKQKYQELKQSASYYQRPDIKPKIDKNKCFKR